MLETDPQISEWIHGILHGEPAPAGDFLKTLAEALKRADPINYAFLKPGVVLIMRRFPKYKCQCGGRL